MSQPQNSLYFLIGGGEMGRLIREKNWAETPLGSPHQWPQTLKTTISLMLNCGFPMCIFWGHELTCFYNDAFRPSLGTTGRHPSILGMPAKQAWQDVWEELEGFIVTAITTRQPTFNKDYHIPILRNDGKEDAYWTFGYSPIIDETNVARGVMVICNETTDTVLNGMRLAESEERFRTMAEGSAILISLSDIHGKVEYFNRAWSNFTGKKLEDLKGTNWINLIHPEDRGKILRIFEENLKLQGSWQMEHRLLNNENEYEWFMVNANPRFDKNKKFLGYVGTAVSINDRKILEDQALKFGYMVDNATDPFVLMKSDSSFEYLNRRALEKWGYTAQEASHLKVSDVDTIYDKHLFDELFKSAQQGELPAFTTIHQSKDGRTFPVEAKVSWLKYQNEPHLLAVIRDISDRRKAEEKLIESERRFREMADHAPLWIWMTDVDINMEYVNRKLLDFIGISHYKEFTGKLWKEKVHEEDIDNVYKAFANAVENRTEFYFEVRVLNAKTEKFEWFYIQGVPRFFGKKLEGFIGTGINIEKQKSFTAKLTKEVEKRTMELARSNSELEKMNEELQSFNYISSHDLQEPLRKIQTFCSLLEGNERENLTSSGRDIFRRIQSAANRMQTLINDLLLYSRTDMENKNFQKVKLEHIVEDVLENLKEEIVKKDAKINIQTKCKIDVVRFQFEQLLYNLISNALKYSKDDEKPIISLSSKNAEVSELPSHLPSDGKYCKILIEDNGIGFDNDYSEKIFELFQRLHTKNKYQGTGLGLAIVKKIVNNHDGYIRAHSVAGKGTKFELFVPLK